MGDQTKSSYFMVTLRKVIAIGCNLMSISMEYIHNTLNPSGDKLQVA